MNWHDALKEMVDKLKPIAKRQYRDNPQKPAEWIIASNIERAPKSAARQKNRTDE